jgi:hypothetical protein
MLKERLAAAKQVAKQLHKFETALNEAIEQASLLSAIMPRAQSDVKISPIVGQDAYSHMHSSLDGLFQSRAATVALHDALNDVKMRLGLRNFTVGVGDLPKLLPPVQPKGLEAQDVAEHIQVEAA